LFFFNQLFFDKLKPVASPATGILNKYNYATGIPAPVIGILQVEYPAVPSHNRSRCPGLIQQDAGNGHPMLFCDQ
jgi:hypothetical protein